MDYIFWPAVEHPAVADFVELDIFAGSLVFQWCVIKLPLKTIFDFFFWVVVTTNQSNGIFLIV